MYEEVVSRDLRGVNMQLLASNRALRLCSQMNYETEVLDIIDRTPTGEVFCDLGACEGRFSVYAALKGLKVISIEPELRNFSALEKNCALNGLEPEQLTRLNLAVGNRNGECQLDVGQPWEGGHQKMVSSIASRNDLEFEVVESQTVKMVRLDDLWAEEALPVPYSLKVDIDGSERIFLEGATKTLRDVHLQHLMIELQVADNTFESIFAEIESHGFSYQDRWQIPNEPGLFNYLFSQD